MQLTTYVIYLYVLCLMCVPPNGYVLGGGNKITPFKQGNDDYKCMCIYIL
jgi:hypothetical protein